MDFQPPKGTDDVVAPASRRWRHLLRVWDELAEAFGYGLVLTPLFESTELFERGVGESSEVVQKQMYTFADRGGRSLTLRPEGTVGVVRAYLGSGAQGSWKAAYSGPMFRYERPQGGRRRQFWQVGVEYLGVEGPMADVEVIHLARRFLDATGAATRLVVNTLGDRRCRPRYLAALTAYLESKQDVLTDEHARRIGTNPLRVLDCKECSPKLDDAPSILDHLCGPCAQHHAQVKAGLESLGLAYVEDARLVRGLDYYVRTAFELVSTELGTAQTALAGGGRYDGLSEAIGGPPAPGVGFAAGVDRILLATPDEAPPELDVFVVAEASAGPSRALLAAAALRERGLRADFDADGRSVKAQFRAAARSGAPFTLLVGDEGGVVEVRWADQREEMSMDEAPRWIQERM